MGKRLSDGNTKVTFVSTIANINAPTVAELTDSGNITCENTITADGLKIGIEQGAVTGDTLASTQTFEGPGRTKAGIDLTFFRDSSAASDRMWSDMTNGTDGYLVVRRGVAAATAYSAGQKVAVYTVTCGEPSELAPEAETYDRAMIKLFPSGTYTREATVAA
ncbi:hypothetical protein HS041_12335 [Planomonospora sp. ID67723]|uniref:phage tail tube protein n=1 Tax=Planomonospora sp. ID67723 TaxID=2738134 RepID=UPI0018C382CC|nr:hypothetical protein [Planomonospora sp. ID67723]MBG0828557.1 hypothetical protein [Planomonospora sp. ID67723]